MIKRYCFLSTILGPCQVFTSKPQTCYLLVWSLKFCEFIKEAVLPQYKLYRHVFFFFRYIYLRNEKPDVCLVQPYIYLWPCPRLSSWKKTIILTAVDYLIATSFPAFPLTDLRKMSTPVTLASYFQFTASFHLLKFSLSRSHNTELIISREPSTIFSRLFLKIQYAFLTTCSSCLLHSPYWF